MGVKKMLQVYYKATNGTGQSQTFSSFIHSQGYHASRFDVNYTSINFDNGHSSQYFDGNMAFCLNNDYTIYLGLNRVGNIQTIQNRRGTGLCRAIIQFSP